MRVSSNTVSQHGTGKLANRDPPRFFGTTQQAASQEFVFLMLRPVRDQRSDKQSGHADSDWGR